ncbi:MAG TPA: hypothetical protein VH594_19975 [Trebonia sp.]
MTDLDTAALRQALRAPGDPADPVDVTQLMTRGRKLRTRRRLAAVVGGLGAVAVLAGTATAIASLTAAPPPGQPVSPAQHGPAQHRPAPSSPSGQQPPRPVPTRHRAPAPVVGPTTDRPATATPATPATSATSATSGANPSPFPSGSPTATPTALPTQASSPTGPTTRRPAALATSAAAPTTGR